MADLTEQQRGVMEYLIGSLDDDGLLRKPLHSIADELAIYHNIDVTEEDIRLESIRKSLLRFAEQTITGEETPEEDPAENTNRRKRSALSIMGSLLNLTGPLAFMLLSAVLLGAAGCLCVIFLPVAGARAALQGVALMIPMAPNDYVGLAARGAAAAYFLISGLWVLIYKIRVKRT